MPLRSLLLSVAAVLAAMPPFAAAAPAAELPFHELEYLGFASLAAGTRIDGEPVGGLSGLVSLGGGRYLALSDDRGRFGPPRFYEIEIDLDEGRLEPGGLRIVSRTTLRDREGRPFERDVLDPEGFARLPDGRLVFASEGVPAKGSPPRLTELDATGRELGRIDLPPRMEEETRPNLGLESLTVTPDGRRLVAALENALSGDGPAADRGVASPSRIAVRDLASRRWTEYLYLTEPVVGEPRPADAFRVAGLVDLLALDDGRLIALEREWTQGAGYVIRLYLVDLEDATVLPPDGTAPATARAASKRLLVDFADLGIGLENFEALAAGPRLLDGRRTLVVLSDDNFDPEGQRTVALAFAIGDREASISAIQGRGHVSPLEDRWELGVEGVVTAVEGRGRTPILFVESERPDADPATSEGLRVEWPMAGEIPTGHRVRIDGRVVERVGGRGQLGVTTLVASRIEVGEAATLPPPRRLGGDVSIPDRVDGDEMRRFRPDADAIDLWESLEGMRLVVPDGGAVIGPTSKYGDLFLLPAGAPERPMTGTGSPLLQPAGAPVDRISLSLRRLPERPQLAVGTRLVGAISGIVDYTFTNYRLVVDGAPEVAGSPAGCAPTDPLGARSGTVRLATYNVENLSIARDAERIERIGGQIAGALGGPEIVALVEIQDDSGPKDGDAVVGSAATLAALSGAVAAAGGPTYAWVSIDPELDREGGQPGGNIRVALLYDPARVALPRRGVAGPADGALVRIAGGRPALDPNPGRVDPTSAAFTLAEGEGVRRSLAVELTVDARPLFVVVNHWSSKYDDDRPWGAIQPPRGPTAAKRFAQASVVRAFAERILAVDPDAAIAVLGDLNEPEWSPGVELVSAPPFANLLLEVPERERYTFNFEGSSQAIDHLVVSPSLVPGAESEVVHLNADCPDEVRTSDHDALLARLVWPPAKD